MKLTKNQQKVLNNALDYASRYNLLICIYWYYFIPSKMLKVINYLEQGMNLHSAIKKVKNEDN